MITRDDMKQLRAAMIELRERLLEGTMAEQDVWALVQRSEEMLKEADGKEFEEDLRLIFSLLSVVWTNQRELEELRRKLAA